MNLQPQGVRDYRSRGCLRFRFAVMLAVLFLRLNGCVVI